MKPLEFEKDSLYVVVGIAFALYIVYSVLYSFTDTEQVKSNAKLASKECGELGIKSVRVDGFTCKSDEKT
jgi:hypothetical protein